MLAEQLLNEIRNIATMRWTIAAHADVLLCSFGGMLRVPSSSKDLFRIKSEGACASYFNYGRAAKAKSDD